MLLSEIPLFDLIFAAEDKHGEETHMVIEAVSKNPDKEINDMDVTTDDIVWWVEFKNDQRVLDTFEEVEKYFLRDDYEPYKNKENEDGKVKVTW